MPFSPKLIDIVRRLVLGLATFATLIALFYAVENWRGDRAWKKYEAACRARGEILDKLPSPSTVPAEQNFFKTPILDRWTFEQGSSPDLNNFLREKQAVRSSMSDALSTWIDGRYPNHAEIAETISRKRAQDKLPATTWPTTTTPARKIITLLVPMNPVIDELRKAALVRPESVIVSSTSINRDNPFKTAIPTFQFARAISISLALHASASLAEGNISVGYEDSLADLKLATGFASSPDASLVQTMIGAVLSKLSIGLVWEGISRHAWDEAQLQILQREIAKINLPHSLTSSFRIEEAMFNYAVDHVPITTWGMTMENKAERLSLNILPHGWIEQNKITQHEAYLPLYKALDARGTNDFLRELAKIDNRPNGFGKPFSPYSMIAAWTVPATRKVTENIIRTQTYLNLAQTACALERHWLAQGSYPKTLAELIPSYLDKVPLDIVNGDPLRYRPTDNGKFLLYSVGLDGKDDGGDTDKDWAWPQAVGSK